MLLVRLLEAGDVWVAVSNFLVSSVLAGGTGELVNGNIAEGETLVRNQLL